jgi:PAS domain S-box-containing protein
MRSFSIKHKILSGFLCIILFMVILTFYMVHALAENMMLNDLRKRQLFIGQNLAKESINLLLIGEILKLQDLVERVMKSDDDIEYIFVMDQNNKVVVHTFSDGIPSELIQANRIKNRDDFQWLRLITERGTYMDLALPISNGTIGSIHVGTSGRSIQKNEKTVHMILIAIFLCVSSIGWAIALLITRKITVPIATLTKVTREINNSNLNQEIAVQSGDEVGELSTSFNHMIKRLRETIVSRDALETEIIERKRIEKNLEKLRHQNELILQSTGEGIFGLDMEGKHTFINSAAAKMLGYEVDNLIGQPSHTIWHHSKKDGNPYAEDECPIYATFTEGKVHTVDDEVFWRKDGSSFPVRYTSTPIQEGGELLGAVVSFSDITKRKQAEEELFEKENRYRLLFNNVSDAVFVHEVSKDTYMPGRFIEVNEIACRYLGYSREELLQMSVPQIDAPETLENVPNILKELFAEGHAMWEGMHVSKDGRKIPVEISNQLFDLHGKPMIMSTVRVITERKAVENKIKHTLSLLKASLESTSEGILVVDNSGKVTLHNKKFQDMWRIPDNLLAEGSDKSFLDYILGQLKEPDAFIKKVNELYASPDKESYDILEFKDGKIFRRYSQAQKIDGEAVGRVWSFRDVTDRERAEKTIREYQKKTEALINASSDYIVLKDMNLRNIILNKACCNLFQLDINDVIGKTDSEFMPEDIALNCRKSDEAALRSEGVIVTEEFSMGKWFHAVKQKVTDENGDVLGVAAVIRDITDRKEYEIKLAKSVKEKETLLKELHHRVKNNLQILTSLISFQIKDDNEARVNEILTECKDRVKTIAIIHDKLYQSEDMTSIEVGKLISDIANSLVYSLRETGNQTNLKLNIQDISIGIDIAIPLGLIINEIVSNSVKHAFPSKMNGEVCIDFYAMNGEFVLNVHDNGIGLPEDFNTEKSDSLGMYLIYTLAEQLNGRAEFIRNNGTTVKIHFKN